MKAVKRIAILSSMLLAGIAANACDDAAEDIKKDCVEDTLKCQDDATLLVCTNGVYVTKETCKATDICVIDACIDKTAPQCDHTDYKNSCVDAKTLKICTADDKLDTKTCDNGCANGECLDKAEAECKHTDYKNSCVDDKTLKFCTKNDKLSTETCEFGCANGACAKDAEPECSHADYKNSCVDEKTLKICTKSDKLSTETCQFGCENGACVVGCTETTDPATCVDENKLAVCNETSGKVEESACQYGCKDGACVVGCTAITHPTTCADSDNLAVCNVDSGKVEESACQYGCKDGACADKCDPEIDVPVCSGKDLLTCSSSSGKMEAEACPNGCADGACLALVVTQDQWIGAGCYCDAGASGANCAKQGVPIPNGKPIIGCENVSTAGHDGSVAVCMPNIGSSLASKAPPTYFPKGYCSLSAVNCTGNLLVCPQVKYGDFNKLTTCPEGSALLTGKFDYKILGMEVTITNKTCVKNCNTDADCNMDGEMSCITKKGASFCYHEDNFSLLGDNYTVEVF